LLRRHRLRDGNGEFAQNGEGLGIVRGGHHGERKRNQTDEQISTVHDSPDGRMPGREALLAMYVHVAHHRGQAEV
jgi:hypothetical protein